MATGAIEGLEEGRTIVTKSFVQNEFLPRDKEGWNEAFEKAEKLFT